LYPITNNNKKRAAKGKVSQNKSSRQNMVLVQAPSAKSTKVKNPGPKMVRGSGNALLVKHREFVTDLAAVDNGLNLKTFVANPGLTSLFTWLPMLAYNYETYRFNNLKLLYRPTCSTQTTGSIIIYFDTDPTDAPASSKAQAAANQGSVITGLWSPVECNVQREMLRKRPKYYVRSGLLTSGSYDAYDVGNFQVQFITPGFLNVNIGELWVEYEIEFLTPELRTNLPPLAKHIQGTTDFLTNPLAPGNVLEFRGDLLVTNENFLEQSLTPTPSNPSQFPAQLFFPKAGTYLWHGKIDIPGYGTVNPISINFQKTSNVVINTSSSGQDLDSAEDLYFYVQFTTKEAGDGIGIYLTWFGATLHPNSRLISYLYSVKRGVSGPQLNFSISGAAPVDDD
jgi:hypothetical protein